MDKELIEQITVLATETTIKIMNQQKEIEDRYTMSHAD